MKPSSDKTSPGRGAKARGFTLVEMLIVIGIIVLLIGIVAPAVSGVLKSSKIASSRAAINLLDSACRQYAADFNDAFPASRYPDTGVIQWYGAEWLVECLTGYVRSSESGAITDRTTDDGKNGFGFRLAQRGKVYGPYNGAENVKMESDATTNPKLAGGHGVPVFVDRFGNPILYFRYTGTTYNTTDNGGWSPPIAFLRSKITAPFQYYRTDFTLCSLGASTTWTANKPPVYDNITNFYGVE